MFACTRSIVSLNHITPPHLQSTAHLQQWQQIGWLSSIWPSEMPCQGLAQWVSHSQKQAHKQTTTKEWKEKRNASNYEGPAQSFLTLYFLLVHTNSKHQFSRNWAESSGNCPWHWTIFVVFMMPLLVDQSWKAVSHFLPKVIKQNTSTCVQRAVQNSVACVAQCGPGHEQLSKKKFFLILNKKKSKTHIHKQ